MEKYFMKLLYFVFTDTPLLNVFLTVAQSLKSLKTASLALCPHFIGEKIELTYLTCQNSLIW